MKKTSPYGKLKRVFGSLVLLACCVSASGRVFYVDADAPGANDGTSWENAYNFLRDALDEAHATANNSATEVWVAQGVYTPDCNSAVPEGTGDREAAFAFLESNITLRGGYAGFGEADPNVRDVNSYETVLCGDLAGNDGPDFANYNENSYHVLVLVGSSRLSFDGFTITGGNADGIGNLTLAVGFVLVELPRDSGGGMCACSQNRPTIKNCIFRKNRAMWGAGMYNNGDWAYPELKNCIFSNNVAYAGGGGIFNGGLLNFSPWQSGTCQIKLVDCAFDENFAALGGGMYAGQCERFASSQPLLENCDFTGNIATLSGGGICNERGTLTVKGCNFIANSTLTPGGLVGGGAIHSMNAIPLWINNCIFSGNASAAVGGAIYAGSCRSSDVVGSTTCGAEVGMKMFTSTFAGNKAANCGGAICFGIGKSEMTNCILWGNIAPEGKSVAVDPHNISLKSEYSDVEGGSAGVFYMEPDCRARTACPGNDPNCAKCTLTWPLARPPTVLGNIDADPCFANPGNWDENGTPDDTTDDFWVNGDYHLKSQTGRWDPASGQWVQDYVTSPCIDAGYPRSDVEPLPHSGYYNMGAYGNTAEASKACFHRSSCGILMEGDLNGDCVVNALDLAVMAQNWRNYYYQGSSWCDPLRAGDIEVIWKYVITMGNIMTTIDCEDLYVLALHWLEEN